MSHLICRFELPQTDTLPPQVSWALFDTKGQWLTGHYHAPLSSLPPQPHTAIILIPSTELVLTRVELPRQSFAGNYLRQAVPYTLEDHFADEVENLHFALGEWENGRLNVAVIQHARFIAYQQAWQQAGLQATLVVPDVFALPLWKNNQWSLTYSQQQLWIRTGAQAGFSLETETPMQLIQMLLDELSPETPTPPELLLLSNTPAQTEQNPVNLKENNALENQMTRHVHPQGWMVWWYEAIKNTRPLNLLQGEYRPTDTLMLAWRPWLPTILLSLALLLVLVVQQGRTYQQFQQQRAQLSTQIENVLHETFPDIKRIVNPRVQMEQHLRDLTRTPKTTTAANAFLPNLTQFGQLFPRFNATLIRLDYRQEKFELQLEIPNLQQLDQLKQAMSEQGFSTETQAVSNRNNVIEARLSVKK